MALADKVSSPTLLSLTDDVRSVLDALDDAGEGTEATSALAVSLATSGQALARKVDSYCAVKVELEARALACKMESDRLRDLARSLEGAVDRLKEAAKEASRRLGIERLRGERGEILVSRQKRDALDILEESKVPAKYKDSIVVHKLNRERLAAGIVYDEAAGTVVDRETGEDLSAAVRVRPVISVRFR